MTIFDWLFGRSAEPNQRSEPTVSTPLHQSSTNTSSLSRPDFAHRRTLPAGNFRFIALDVETACSDVASICQIGLACVQPDNRIQTFSMMVNPGTRFDPFNTQLHGIGPDQVADSPRFSEALEHLNALLSRHHLVQHSNFDKQAIAAACRSCGLPIPEFRWADSVTIARRAWPELKGNGGHGLANLKKVLDLQFHHHDAGEDARAAATVVLHAEAHLRVPFEELVKPVPKRRYPDAITKDGNPAGALAGAVVVFTGALSMSRADAADLAARLGMCVKAGVTQKTTHLVVGDQDLTLLAGHTKSSKHRKAEELKVTGHPIQIIGETDFKALVDTAGLR
ncbi:MULTISPECIES: exonuclease domain-containing protein [unclassified Yoonia]|uniref:exonuclease domain-containing protein n=1 Tax=unclassified Yoonia TaxID=2629118 RepID=UPI002AFF693B|nr:MULTISPECIES: exonuclease domain-containing protein [unclassified Yoonia]